MYGSSIGKNTGIIGGMKDGDGDLQDGDGGGLYGGGCCGGIIIRINVITLIGEGR